MKVKAYVRIARNPNGSPKIHTSTKRNPEPLKDTYGDALPTVAFAVEFNIADSAFKLSEQLIASVDVEHPTPLATVRQIAPEATA